MTGNELRQKYLDFFKSKGHAILPSASLIPENDPSVLFTTAGMHPLVPYLMGEKHPEGVRLANSQKCIRTTDIDEVGDATHHTFFEMLGNWSLGDYFKKEAIEWSWEFLTSKEWLGLDKNRLAVSVFVGDDDAPFDDDAYTLWKNLGVSEKRIARLPKKNNWWGPAGATGPCGPDTEMFYWSGDPAKIPESFNDDHISWVEIWNDVFMQFNKDEEGKYILLSQKNVDTGMGLERTLAVVSGLSDNYKTEFFNGIIRKIEELSGKKYEENNEITRAMRIVADHLKAATFIMGDDKGVTPSNTDQGYVVRRLIRRAVRFGKQLCIAKPLWTAEISEVVLAIYAEIYPELIQNKEKILKELSAEEEKFIKTLSAGQKKIEASLSPSISPSPSPSPAPPEHTSEEIGKILFKLRTESGFPLDQAIEELEKRGIDVDDEAKEFQNIEFKKHQNLSRTASAGKFKGGLADGGEETKKLHTASHLMLAAMRQVLGEHVHQKGSNITPERLRFDFSHPEKVTAGQLAKIEKLVNETITADATVSFQEMSLGEAKNAGAEGVFESKYGEKVKVYTAEKDGIVYSKEICGGPHVEHTGVLGHFKIQKEESSSAGVRRIKAILE